MNRVHSILRFVIAALVIMYGFAKLNGSQFTVLESELDKPMGQVSGFWLTWYYFGYSKFYGNFIALVQVIGGILLMFRQTTLLACCLLLPLIGNIILIDVFYAIDPGALLVAVFIEAGLLIILAPHFRDLRELFWVKQADHSKPSAKVVTVGKHALRVLVILVPALFTYWVAHYNNRFPTPLDGGWDVIESASKTQAEEAVPAVVFFERNRAHLCVFKRKDRSYDWHHFELDPATRSITIWKYWLQKGPKIYEGHYELSGSNLVLKGRLGNSGEDSEITLKKRG